MKDSKQRIAAFTLLSRIEWFSERRLVDYFCDGDENRLVNARYGLEYKINENVQ